ncbi:uncharacterized protein A4U43_C05F4910 [Asparagus officinalis]|uniref:Uncharacterized protein n=1 Tax=Asparagus officinalis TaxID=4686 RepID=A0A5P1EPF7_ASPOF|nr:uncharacterized protein A4U43_C05F4910 [Asparagus officinalis]
MSVLKETPRIKSRREDLSDGRQSTVNEQLTDIYKWEIGSYSDLVGSTRKQRKLRRPARKEGVGEWERCMKKPSIDAVRVKERRGMTGLRSRVNVVWKMWDDWAQAWKMWDDDDEDLENALDAV